MNDTNYTPFSGRPGPDPWSPITDPEREIAELARADFRVFLNESYRILEQDEANPFRDDWFYGALAEHAEALVSGQLRRLVVTSPPGTYKSRTWGVCLVGWAWLARPNLKFLVGANEESLAIRDSLLTRRLVRSGWYREAFSPTWALSADQDAKKLFSNTRGGHRQVTSANASVVGKKFDIGVIDDLHDAVQVHRPVVRENECRWFDEAYFDRQQDFTKSAIVVIAHPLHPQDITRRLIARGWPHLSLCERMESRLRKTFPLGGSDPRREGEYLRPHRFGPAEEREVKENQGELVWEAKYQGLPRTSEGSMFPKEKIGEILPVAPAGTVAVRYWDTAARKEETSSFSSGVLLGRQPSGRWIVIDVHRGKWSWAERDREIKKTAESDRWRLNVAVRDTLIEHPGGSGGVQVGEIIVSNLAGYNVHIDTVTGKGDKAFRAGPLSSQWLAGNVDLVAGRWNEGYLDRMEAFPGLPEKDDTDASSGAFNAQALKGDGNQELVTGKPSVDSMPKGTLGTIGRRPIDPRREKF